MLWIHKNYIAIAPCILSVVVAMAMAMWWWRVVNHMWRRVMNHWWRWVVNDWWWVVNDVNHWRRRVVGRGSRHLLFVFFETKHGGFEFVNFDGVRIWVWEKLVVYSGSKSNKKSKKTCKCVCGGVRYTLAMNELKRISKFI